MTKKINIGEIYDKNINFLIGSGASFGLFPTLSLEIKNELGERQTIETLATDFEQSKYDNLKTYLFMHYYKECIEPVMEFDIDSIKTDSKKEVIDNYEYFLKTILSILSRRQSSKKCNIFTTNYDGCIEFTADRILKDNKNNFILNDGGRGFNKRYLQAKNFNSRVYETGIFDTHKADLPQINLLHLHGSVYWKKDDEKIIIDYNNEKSLKIKNEVFEGVENFTNILNDESHHIENLSESDYNCRYKAEFWDAYNKLPIVNPTKWKFHETVFEEHYYQMLRLLSYELEKNNSIFITFGFSFADEHILHLVQRSLTNPTLQVFICCFDSHEKMVMTEKFKEFNNVTFVTIDGFLTFKSFNQEVFTLKEPRGWRPWP